MMRKLVKLQKDNQGFTLVELMIVVAIIGILAAIAIPQFAAYRIRGFNTSALSDTKNALTSEAALVADFQRMGTSSFTAGAAFAPPLLAAIANGVACLGGDADGDGLGTIDAAGNARGVTLPIGNGVSLFAITDAVPALAAGPSTFQVGAKHGSGDTTYASDADSTSLYQFVAPAADALKIGVPLTVALYAAKIVANTPGVDNINGVAGWAVK